MVKLAAPFPPRRPSSLLRFAVASVAAFTLFYYMTASTHQFPPSSYFTDKNSPLSSNTHPEQGRNDQAPIQGETAPDQEVVPFENDKPPDLKSIPDPPASSDRHPIDELIETAESTFDGLMKKRTKKLDAAAEAYRERRGRHPPPGFETWFKYARERDAFLVEDFFDQIYHDLEPFWALDPADLRKEAASYEMYITVRNGYANATSDWFWTRIWLDLIQTIDHLLPDMDIALNPMDEPRIIVPYEEISKHVEDAQKTKTMAPPQDVATGYQQLPAKKDVDKDRKVKKKSWEKTSKLSRRNGSGARRRTKSPQRDIPGSSCLTHSQNPTGPSPAVAAPPRVRRGPSLSSKPLTPHPRYRCATRSRTCTAGTWQTPPSPATSATSPTCRA